MINLERLESDFAACRGRVKYLLGAKAALDAMPSAIKRIDCSGWSRWAIWRAMGIKVPEGSQNQLAWARKNLRKLAKYSDVAFAKDDPARVFLAFLSPAPGKEWPRHVWLVRAGMTMESYGSGGVNSRPWDAKALLGCRECFELK